MQEKIPNFWESRYQAGTTGWDRGKPSPNLTHWLKKGGLKPCRILVPGCGNGYEVLTLAAKGFEVVAVDIAPSAVNNLKAELEKNDLTAEVIESDFFSLDFSQNPFDAIYEQTSLCALQPSEWKQYEQWLYASLKSGGMLYSQFMQTNEEGGPPFHCDMSEMMALFDEDRWQWLEQLAPQPMPGHSQKEETPCLLSRR